MFCPQCKGEYRPGFTHCVDCDVDLVEKLPELDSGPGGQSQVAELEQVWNGADQGECVYVCALLKESGIPFKIFEQREEFWKAEQAYRIGVPTAFVDRAQQIIDTTVLGDQNDQTLDAMELPADETDVAEEPEEVDNWDPDKWDPETATIQLWSGQDLGQAGMIESSLRENHIHSRSENLENGSRSIFVEPDNQARAQEIVREIETGSPEA